MIKGKILDYETKKSLAGVTVTVMGTDWKVQSDEDGVYSFPEIPVGYYVLTFQFEGYYADTRTDVIVRSGRTTFLNIQMLTIRLIPPLVDRVGWEWAFVALVPGPVVGIASMLRLRALPAATRMASGNR